MASKLEQVEQQALSLSPEERAKLAERLWQSVQGDDAAPFDDAWIEEAERRYRELAEGRVQGVPAEQVFARIRARMGWQA